MTDSKFIKLHKSVKMALCAFTGNDIVGISTDSNFVDHIYTCSPPCLTLQIECDRPDWGGEEVRHLAASKTTIATCDYYGYINLWDSKSGDHTHTIDSEQKFIDSLVFSKCGKYLAFSTQDKVAMICLSLGKIKWTENFPRVIKYVSFSDDGKHVLVTHSGATFTALCSESKKISYNVCYQTSLHVTPAIQCATLSPDSTQFIALLHGTLEVFDTKTKKKVFSFLCSINPDSDYHGLAISPDRKRLAVVCSDAITIIDPRDWTPQFRFISETRATPVVSFSADSTMLLVSTCEDSVLWTLPEDHVDSLKLESSGVGFFDDYVCKLSK